MAKEEPDLTALLPSKVPLKNLVLGTTMQHVFICVLRMWEAKNYKFNGSLMSLDFLLLDEKESLIQGSIHHRRIHKFKDLLKEGNLYLITNFEVVPTYNQYKVTDHPFTIRFMDTTQIMQVAETACSIKLEKFRLHTYAEFHRFAGTNLHLLDVAGQILQVQGPNLEDPTSNQKIVLLILLEDNSTIRLTLWDSQASQFRHQFKRTAQECNVIVCTCMNPKMFAGKLHLNSTGSTKIYINHKLEVVTQFMKRMGIERNDSSTTIVEDKNEKLNLEILTIEEIFAYLSSGSNQEKEAICHAKIVDICTRNGWHYLSCASCSKKLGRSTTSLFCNTCNQKTAIGVARFRVELEVKCGDRTTTFVLFDRDARNVTNTTAEDIAVAEGNEEATICDSKRVPKCLLGLVGKTMDFQIKISQYNFKASRQCFTVTRIVNEQSNEELNANITEAKAIQTTNDKEAENMLIKIEDGEKVPTFNLPSNASKLEIEEIRKETHAGMQPLAEESDEKKLKKQRVA